MIALLSSLTILAAEAGGPPAAGAGGGQIAGGGGGIADLFLKTPLLPMLLAIVAYFWLMSRSQRKRDKARQDMLDAIQPKDDVVTIGGIEGRVVRIGGDKVILRIDADKDVKITVARSGISRKLGQEEKK